MRRRKNPTRYKKASSALYKGLKDAGVAGQDNRIAYRRTLDDLEIEYEDFLEMTAGKNSTIVLMRLIDDRLQSYGEGHVDAMPEHVVSYASRLLREEIGDFSTDELDYFLKKHAMWLFFASNGSKVAKRRCKEAAIDLAGTLS